MGNIKRQKIIKCKIFLNILAISIFQLIVRKHDTWVQNHKTVLKGGPEAPYMAN